MALVKLLSLTSPGTNVLRQAFHLGLAAPLGTFLCSNLFDLRDLFSQRRRSLFFINSLVFTRLILYLLLYIYGVLLSWSKEVLDIMGLMC